MKEYKLIHRHLLGKNIKSVAFSHDDSLIAAFGERVYIGTIDGKALYYEDPKEDYEKHYWNLTKNVAKISVSEAKWSSDDKYLWCIAGNDFYEFSLENLKFRRIFQTKQDLKCLDINYSKNYIALAGKKRQNDSNIYIINPEGKLLNTIKTSHSRQIDALLFSFDGTKIVSAGDDKYIRVWNTETSELLDEYQFDDNPRKLYGFNEDNLFIAKLRYDTSLFSLDENGKIELVKNLQKEVFVKKSKGLLGYSNKDKLVICSDYFNRKINLLDNEGKIEASIETPGYLNFVEVGNSHDIIAVIFKYRNGPSEISFYSTENEENFIGKDNIINWEVQKTYPDIHGLQLIVPYKKFQGNWIGVATSYILIYDSEFNPLFKKKTDSQIYKSDFNSKTQKLVYYKLNEQVHIIDFNQIDINTIDEKQQLSENVANVIKVKDIKWNHNGDKIALITDKRELIIYDSSLKELDKHEFRKVIHCLTWNKTDDKIVIGSDDGIIYYYDIKKEKTKELLAIGIDRIYGITWNIELGEFIVTGNRFINIFNNEGYIIRKFDFKKDIQFKFPTYRPNSTQIAVYGYNRGDHEIYIIDRNKSIRECIDQIITYHTDWIDMVAWENKDSLISLERSSGLVFWKLI